MGDKKDLSDAPLSREDSELWNEVRRTVDPLSERPRPDKAVARKSGGLGDRARPGPTPELSSGVSRKPPAPVEGLEPRLSRRIASGRAERHSTIDLHGLTRDEAHAALVRHIERARLGGEKWVLVITGKGRNSEDDPLLAARPGVLRRALPDWLKGEDLAPHVVAFEPARQRHGGSGAFYVQLRGKRGG